MGKVTVPKVVCCFCTVCTVVAVLARVVNKISVIVTSVCSVIFSVSVAVVALACVSLVAVRGSVLSPMVLSIDGVATISSVFAETLLKQIIAPVRAKTTLLILRKTLIPPFNTSRLALRKI
jgi:hypothetical protein